MLVQIASENNLGEGVIVKIKFNIIASLYDYNPNLATYMKVRATLSIPGWSWWVVGRGLVSQGSVAEEGPWIPGERCFGGRFIPPAHLDCLLLAA